ncbi:PREDICTED: disheveled-associated activator of morphogenesis 1 isoform X2 [Nicrophorus vespilloides]|uniref:Disheveled-associated activator of morphogenesis 1 isoform X2 n=1 Tax=Nicrophorus vespilloides TaxID=110193 RepID=A0ABM1NKH8_NICVS|nr:PREDICTED: disheveled-associated activator of morphogenesis 1 isoform X2 [Nicrophorus vespilloides]
MILSNSLGLNARDSVKGFPKCSLKLPAWDNFTNALPRLHIPAMPAVRSRRGWCGCLQDDEPPEITYCVVENTGTLSLQAITPTQPMPPQDELDAKFAELVEELDLTAPNKAAMLGLPSQKKWQIYCSQKGGEDVVDLTHAPEHYIEILKTFANQECQEECNIDEDVRTRTKQIDGLKTALRTSTHSFVIKFIELEGLPALLDFLTNMDYFTAQSTIHTSIIGCVKALMNNSTGRAHVLAHPTSINTIAQSLSTENIKTKIAVLEILGAVCLVSGGHKKVLDAMHHYQKYAYERIRFQGIINDLDRSTGVYRDEVNLKTAIMSFINAVLNYDLGQENLEFRLHLRYEFLMLGIQPVIDKLRRHENETLDRHLDFFEMIRNDDEKELAKKFDQEHIDTKSASAMFDLIRRKLSHTPAYPHLLSLLKHCLTLPVSSETYPQYWLLFDRIVQQIALQQNELNGVRDPDLAPIKINVQKIVHLLAKEEELVAARKMAGELEKENNDMSNRLAKKEQELDQRTQEKEDIESSLARIKERLEKETASHIETRQKYSELEYRITELDRQINCERGERHRLERLVTSGNIPDDAKVIGLKSAIEGGAGAEIKTNYSPIPPPPPPLAPPPPPAPGPPPPPCAPMAPPEPLRMEMPKKNVPQPANPLKSFNWSKLPDAKLNGTIWSELDDTKLYNAMELDNIDKLFCAYQKNGVTNEGSIEDLRQLGKGKTKVLSVIDGRRAQNCTILLSKLKMSDEDITKSILSMDSKEQLPIDMVEQLLKFTPSPEERALLEEHGDEIDSLARADRFLYEISKVPHYEQRLRSLHYKKRFTITVNEILPRIASVMEASREVSRSRRLRRLLEIVLALGNYMNRGARGNASGFKLASLNRLADTKSSASKGTTLLHYLVLILEKKFKDILRMDEDLSHVRDAAKVSLAELNKDMGQLRAGLKDVTKEIEFHRKQNPVANDKFVPVMREFQATATCRLAEIEDQYQDMKTRFERAVRLFGEDPNAVQPDEFFGIFDTFLMTFTEARQDNENMRKRQEEEEKRAKQEEALKKLTLERKHSREGILSSISKSLSLKNGETTGDAKGEFDDLISALRTGDVFGEDIAKFKRSRKNRIGAGNSPPRRNSVNRDDSRERVITNGCRQ